jgi:hypothetical protein
MTMPTPPAEESGDDGGFWDWGASTLDGEGLLNTADAADVVDELVVADGEWTVTVGAGGPTGTFCL